VKEETASNTSSSSRETKNLKKQRIKDIGSGVKISE
jgi:hypothetical protein